MNIAIYGRQFNTEALPYVQEVFDNLVQHNKVTPPEVAMEFHQYLPESDLIWIDKCGHAPMMEQPAEFNIALKAFLEKTA